MGFTERLLTTVMSTFENLYIQPQIITNLLTTSTVVLFLVVLAIIRAIQHYRYLRSLPEGPWGVPVLGSLAKFTKPFHLQMYEFSRQFGSFVSVRMGSQLIVCLNDAKTIRKVFSRSEFTARPKSALDCIVEGFGKSMFTPFSYLKSIY